MDAAKEMGAGAVEQAKERFKIHYFSYILTSLIAFNWQNILLLIMSDSSIEKLLGDWNGDPGFAQDYFWKPIVIGYLASVILPALAIPIAVGISYISSLLSESDEWIGNLKKCRKTKRDSRLASAVKNNETAQRELKSRLENIQIQQKTISNLQLQKDKLEEFFSKLSAIYMDHPNIDTEEGFRVFLEKVTEKKLFAHYPANSSVWFMLNKIKYKKEEKDRPPVT
ncbi:hypothetical protein ACYJ2I_004054 [Enterobacter hormaechei]